MRVVTIVSLGASAVLGLGALVVAKTVLPNQAAARAALSGTPVTGVQVVVAASAMKYGDKVDAQHLRVIKVPADAAPEGAFTSVAAVLAADHGGPPVVLTPIAAREPILPTKLSGPGARASVAAEIKEGMRAYTVKVTDVSGVGGHALPGDRVDVVLLRDLNPNGPMHNFVSEVVLQDVRVLAVDLNADLASDKPATPSTATLEVNVEDSQKLAVAADLGKLSLALRRTGAAEVTPTALVRTSQFTGGASGGPAAPRGRYVGRTLSIRTSGPILIVQGERRGAARVAPPPPPPPPPAATNG
jgi:pilus assembly protein CpaB